VYALAQQQQGREVAAVGFARPLAGNCHFAGIAEQKELLALTRETRGYAEQVAAWPPVLEQLAQNFVGGRAEVDPRTPPASNGSPCRLCAYPTLCRIAEQMPASAGDDEEAADE